MRRTSELKVPSDLQQCQDMIVQMFEQMQSMQGQLDALLRARYGMKSESVGVGQLRLFGDESAQTEAEEPKVETVPGPVPGGHGRKKPSKHLPRIRQVHDLPEAEMPCPDCHLMREVIGEEVSEQYDYSPASIQIIEHVRIRRACKHCNEHVVTAQKPGAVIEKGLAAPGMLAFVATSKFQDHLPLNRLEGIFKRDGAAISRSTMCDWMTATARCLLPLYERMKQLVLESKVIWTDDTPVKMQDRSDERNIRNARVWVYIGDSVRPFTIFDFTQSRKRDGPVQFLGDFKGYLQADAFSGYDCIYAGGSVREVACWAHARRKFYDAQSTARTACNEVLAMIQDLYVIEKEVQQLSDHERQVERQNKSVPILLRLKTWLDRQKLVALPKSPLGKAVNYALNNWAALCTFTEVGNLTIDNNKSERAVRGTAIGRKNWLFVGSPAGGRTAAVITSFMVTCRAHNIHPRVYLQDVLTRLSQGTSNLDDLLPGRWQPVCT